MNIRGTNNVGYQIVDTDLSYELYDNSRTFHIKHLGSGSPTIVGYYDASKDTLTLDVTYSTWSPLIFTCYRGTMTLETSPESGTYGDLMTNVVQ